LLAEVLLEKRKEKGRKFYLRGHKRA